MDLDFRQLLLGLAGPQGAQVRSAASQALAARLFQKEAKGATNSSPQAAKAAKAKKPSPLPESGDGVSAAFQRQQERRATKALRVPSSAYSDRLDSATLVELGPSRGDPRSAASALASAPPCLAARRQAARDG